MQDGKLIYRNVNVLEEYRNKGIEKLIGLEIFIGIEYFHINFCFGLKVTEMD